MKKTTIILILLPFIISVLYGQPKSQKADVTWGKEFKGSKKTTLSDVVGYDETGIYAIKTRFKKLFGKNTNITLEHFNKQMNLRKSSELTSVYQGNELLYEGIVQLGAELYLFSSYKNTKLKRNFMFVQSINKKTLLLNRDMKKIAEINYKGKSKFNAGEFHHTLSRDSTKVLVYYNFPRSPNDYEKIGLHVFDDNMNQLWAKEVKLPYVDKLLDIVDYQVDNFGDVQLLGKAYKDKYREKRKGKPNYKYQIFSYSNEGTNLKEYSVKIQGKFLTDMQIAVNREKDIICAGFYSNEGTRSIMGAYFVTVDGDTKEIKTQSFKEFDIDFITQNTKKREAKKTKKKAAKGKDVELVEYELDNIVLRSDGGAVLVGEQFYIELRTTTTMGANGGMSSHIKTYYYFNDIIVISFSPEGEIDWAEKIAKRQVTCEDGGFYSSYAFSVVDDKLYFIFNDNPKNLFYKGTGKVAKYNKKSKESLVVLVELDSKGNQEREALFSTREANIITRPKVCEQISPNEMVLFGQRKKMHRFAKIKF